MDKVTLIRDVPHPVPLECASPCRLTGILRDAGFTFDAVKARLDTEYRQWFPKGVGVAGKFRAFVECAGMRADIGARMFGPTGSGILDTIAGYFKPSSGESVGDAGLRDAWENRMGDAGKPHCCNGFQVALNMSKAAFWSPAEPTWDFKVCAAPRSSGHFAGGGWLMIGVPSVITWNRPTPRPARLRPAGGRRTLLVPSSWKGFLFWLSEGRRGEAQGEAPAGCRSV